VTFSRGLVAAVAVLVLTATLAAALDRADRPKPFNLAPAGAKPPRQLVGVQLHPFFLEQTRATVARELDVANAAGANAVRIDLPWSSLELTGPGRIDEGFARRVDSFLDAARAHRLAVVAVFHATPCWAAAAPRELEQGCRGRWWDRGVTAYPPGDPQRYGAAAAYVARRWGDRLAALQVWNEPNNPEFLVSHHPASDYGALLRAAYPRIKAARPGLEVLGGSFAEAERGFLQDLFDEGHIAGNYDGIAWHPYTAPYSPRARAPRASSDLSFRDGAAALREVMRANGDRNPELWATEAGASTCNPSANDRCVSLARQARWIRDYVEVARTMPGLRALIIYNLRDKGTDPNAIEDGFGLIRRNFSPKPSLGAFARAVAGR
jgi:hypothetical protein